MYGRGVMDDKAGLAAMILIARVLRETGIKLAGDVSLESVVGEEWGGGGSLGTLLLGHKGDAVIVIEPTELKVCNVCRGGATFQIIVPGRGAHPIEPEKGISAIEKAYAVLRALANLRDIRQERLTRCFNGEYPNLTPLLVGGIEGEIAQKVPERCILRGLIGFPPDEGFADVKADLEGFVANVASLDPWLRNHPPIVTWDGFMKEGCEVMVDDPFVRSCLKAQAEVLGRDIPAGTFRAACDLHYYVRYWGIPGIIFGPGNCVVAHSSDEWVDLTELLVFTKALAGMILQWSL
jgi:acetylornithine deacetylase